MVNGDVDLTNNGDTIDIGETAQPIHGSSDIYITKFNSTLTACAWSMRLGGTGTDQAFGIIRDSSDNIILTGIVSGNADLDGNGSSADGGPEMSLVNEDAIMALESLGYERFQIIKFMNDLPKNITETEDIVKYFLKSSS